MFPLLAAALAPLVQDATPTVHTADAALFIRIPDVQALRGAYAQSAAARLLADADLQTALGQVMQAPDAVDPIALLMQEYNAAVSGGEFPPLLEIGAGLKSLSLSFDVPDGDLYAFLGEVRDANARAWQGIEEDADSVDPTEHAGFRFVADFVDAESCAKASRALEMVLQESKPWRSEITTRELMLGGADNAFGTDTLTVWDYQPRAGEDGPVNANESLRMVAGETRIALSSFGVHVEDFAREIAGVADADSWAGERGFAALGASAGIPILDLYFNSPLIPLIAENEPLVLPLLDIVEGLVGPAASAAIHGGHWSIAFDADSGQFVTRGAHAPSEAGPLSGLLGAQPLDGDALTLAHPDAMAATVTSFDKDVLLRLMTDIVEEEEPGLFDGLQEKYGFRPDTDLVGSLGDAVSYSLSEIKSLVAAPNLMVAVELDDPVAFEKGMDGLLRLIAEEGEGLEVSRREYRKISTLYEFSIADLMGGAPEIPGLPIDLRTFIRPTVAILQDGRAVFTMTAGYAKKEVRRIRALSDDATDLHAGMAAMGANEGATTLTHADWARLVAGVYDIGKALVPMIGGGMDLPVDVTKLPNSDLITRYYKPTQRVVWIEGDRVRHEVRSSFGPETTLTPALAGFAGTMAFQARPVMIEAAPVAVPQVAEEAIIEDFVVSDHTEGAVANDTTLAALRDFEVALVLYSLDHDGAYPATLDALLAKTAEYPDGYLAGGSVPNDGWDHAFHYAKTDDAYTLYSIGPNGVDDGGAGDDVTVR